MEECDCCPTKIPPVAQTVAPWSFGSVSSSPESNASPVLSEGVDSNKGGIFTSSLKILAGWGRLFPFHRTSCP